MLKEIKLKQNWIYEVVMETGDLHRAPIGVWTEDFEYFIVDVYKDSSTFSNLHELGVGTIYFIEDPKFFVETKDLEYFAKVDFKVTESLTGNPTRFTCKALNVDVLKEGKPMNRAEGMFLEYLVDWSRRNLDDKARERCAHFKKTIKKVAPGSVYDKIIE